MTLKILNLYAGIGGNRKLWGGDMEVTAIEIDPQIAKIYQDFFPNDKVIVTDAHQFLLEHYNEFDFIWSSPPCQSHSQIRFRLGVLCNVNKAVYPDMKLYEEIIFMNNHCKCKWVVENVKGYYKPLIKPQSLQRHYFWSNFIIADKHFKKDNIRRSNNKFKEENLGFNLSKYKGINKETLLRNCVKPEVALHIFNLAFKDKQRRLVDLA